MKNYLPLLFCFIFLSCSEQIPEKKSEASKKSTLVKQQKVTKKVAKKPLHKKLENDTINSKNTVEFLRLYGKKNKESIVLIKTRLGKIKIQLYKDTPLHRASFVFFSKIWLFQHN